MTRPIFLPPRKFRPATAVKWAEFQPRNNPPAFTRLKGAQARGLAYEYKAQRYFMQRYAPGLGHKLYIPGPWIRFVTADPRAPEGRWAQPDGFIIDLALSRITVIEMKIRHMQSAWWGLRNLYEPLFRIIFGSRWTYSVCEVVNYYEPHTPWPERYTLTKDPSQLRTNEFGVMILSDREMRPTLESL